MCQNQEPLIPVGLVHRERKWGQVSRYHCYYLKEVKKGEDIPKGIFPMRYVSYKITRDISTSLLLTHRANACLSKVMLGVFYNSCSYL